MKVAALAVFAALSAAPASAMVRVSPVSPRINPLVGLPALLPSPLNGPLAGHGVTLPAPLLTPSVALAPLAPAPVPTVTLAAPAAAGILPAVGMNAGRENAPNPFTALLPDAVMRLSSPAESAKPAAGVPQDDELRGLFDGARERRDIAWEPILPRERRDQSRRHSLPEDDLESELGLR